MFSTLVTIQLVSAVKRSLPENIFRSFSAGVGDLARILRPIVDEPAKSIASPGTHLGRGAAG